MKKGAILAFLIFSSFVFSQGVSGIVQIAGESDFPKGYFARAQGYLPGDSITITNEDTGVTLQALNLGTLDASSGIALLISRESAASLGLNDGDRTTVSLLPRTGDFDETVSGIATISVLNDLTKNSTAPEITKAEDSTVPAEPVVTTPEPVEEEEIVNTDTEEDEGTEESSTPPEDFVVEDVAAEETPPAEDYENVEDSFQETKVAVEKPSPLDAVEEEKVETESVPPLQDNENEKQEEIAETDNVEQEEAEPLLTEEGSDEYSPIVLVPTEPEAPESSSEEETTPAEEVPPEEPKQEDVAMVPVETPTEEMKNEESFSKYIVQTSDLATNCYYIQIAAYKNTENIESTVAKYSRYPLALVENASGIYQVMIGPLNVDEYSAVLTRVRKAGFSDAFVRKR